MNKPEIIPCVLCAGSPSIERYPVLMSDGSVVRVDVCIGKEIQSLVTSGVKTLGCCCGHGVQPTCLVKEDSRGLLESMGYVVRSYSTAHDEDGIKEIVLKTDVQTELRKVLGCKPWHYLPKMVPLVEEKTPSSSANEDGEGQKV